MLNKPIRPMMAGLALLCLALPFGASATETHELSIQNHRFQPDTLTVPAGEKIKLVIKNLDNSPEEFESYSLHREKLIPAGGKITVYIGPLDAGSYKFFGEFHSKTAKGVIIAK